MVKKWCFVDLKSSAALSSSASLEVSPGAPSSSERSSSRSPPESCEPSATSSPSWYEAASPTSPSKPSAESSSTTKSSAAASASASGTFVSLRWREWIQADGHDWYLPHGRPRPRRWLRPPHLQTASCHRASRIWDDTAWIFLCPFRPSCPCPRRQRPPSHRLRSRPSQICCHRCHLGRVLWNYRRVSQRLDSTSTVSPSVGSSPAVCRIRTSFDRGALGSGHVGGLVAFLPDDDVKLNNLKVYFFNGAA